VWLLIIVQEANILVMQVLFLSPTIRFYELYRNKIITVETRKQERELS